MWLMRFLNKQITNTSLVGIYEKWTALVVVGLYTFFIYHFAKNSIGNDVFLQLLIFFVSYYFIFRLLREHVLAYFLWNLFLLVNVLFGIYTYIITPGYCGGWILDCHDMIIMRLYAIYVVVGVFFLVVKMIMKIMTKVYGNKTDDLWKKFFRFMTR